jgi:hypothetical protein
MEPVSHVQCMKLCESILSLCARPESRIPVELLPFGGADNIHTDAPLHNYIARLTLYSTHDSFIDLWATVFIYHDRLAAAHIPISTSTCHRFLLAAYCIAQKVLDDTTIPNKRAAQIGGIPTKELNRLERKLLGIMDWNVHVCPDELAIYRSLVTVDMTTSTTE